jgi:hypothetical protein
MPQPKDEHNQDVLADLVNDAIVTGTYSPLAGATHKQSRCWRVRIDSKELDRRLDPSPYWRIAFM